MWEVEGTDEFADWYALRISDEERVRVEAAIQELEEKGPGLGRPWSDSLVGTRVKELIPRGGFLRILFRFDPRRSAILLLGGDKRDDWADWYREAIPAAERLYEAYLAELRDEGAL